MRIKAKFRKLRPKLVRRSKFQREAILDKFRESQAKGALASEAAKEAAVPLSTLYRWQREEKARKTEATSAPAQDLSIDDAIRRLCLPDCHDDIRYTEALFKFLSWLRWSTESVVHPSAIVSCVVSYLHKNSQIRVADQLAPEHQKLLLRHLRLDALQKIYSPEILELPFFELFPIDNQPFNEFDFLADIVWFLIAYDPPTSNPKDAASLAKAYFLISEDVFKFRWKISFKTFRTVWKKNAPATPFLYVERHHSGLNFTVDPNSSSFAEDINELLERKDLIRQYFSHCRHVVETLAVRLDSRALSAVRFPRFPEALEPIPITPHSLPVGISEALKGYGMAYKRL